MIQIAGVSDPSALAVLCPAVDHLVVGEEMYAAGAYLGGLPAHLSSLAAQDWVRWGLIVILAGLGLMRAVFGV